MKRETDRCVRDGVRCAHSSPSPSNGTRGYHICNYFLDTGMKRGCPAGEECDRYVKHWTRVVKLDTIGARLRYLRKSKGISQYELAEKLEVSQNQISV